MRMRITLWPLLCTVLCMLTGCGAVKEYGPITDVNDLEGRRVGVNLSWAEDYRLSGRRDLQLFRYDSTADMILALKYDKIDAIALDDATWALMDSVNSGVEKVEPAIGYTGYLLYFAGNKEAFLQDLSACGIFCIMERVSQWEPKRIWIADKEI